MSITGVPYLFTHRSPEMKKYRVFYLFLLIISILLTSCAGSSGGNPSVANPATVMLSKLPWCNGKPDGTFMDDSSPSAQNSSSGNSSLNGTATALDWGSFKANLGFALFLPTGLPTGSCLLNAFGWVHNATSQNTFILTYLLPDHSSLTIAQTLQLVSKAAFQCFTSPDTSTPVAQDSKSLPSATATAASSGKLAPMRLCSGARNTTNITFSARWTSAHMQQFFHDLQQNIDWTPTV